MKVALILCVISLSISACQTTSSQKSNLMNVSPSSGHKDMTKWNNVVKKTKYNVALTHSAKSLLPLVTLINQKVNKIPYVKDIDNYGVEDYWATPQEFMTRGGDCEDYAYTKYVILKNSGVSKKDMRIAIVYDTRAQDYHAILLVTVDERTYVLDNNTDKVLEAYKVTHYNVLYHINETELWTLD